MPDSPKKHTRTVRPSDARDTISAVTLSERLTADVDAWAEAHNTVRSDAIRQLVELGLNAAPAAVSVGPRELDPIAIEDLAVQQLGNLLDPSLPTDERERRIRRLTEGPPEFADQRIDLPKHPK